ncbi:MAG TPA: hypothetical protein VGI39_34910 [Polyangiaceae bacterium]|jgi:hypothetical protein
MGRTTWTVVLTAAGIVAACSNSPPYPNASSLAQGIAKAECQEAANCGTSTSACETERAQYWEAQATAVGADRTFNSDKAQAAVDLANSTYGGANNAKITAAQQAALADAFQQAFVGNVPTGQSCAVKYDCAGYASKNEICDGGHGSTPSPKICVGMSLVAPGPTGFCAEPGQTCASGSYCNASGICIAGAVAGAACDVNTSGSCAMGLYCNAGLCAPLAPSGGPCTQNSDCSDQAPFCNVYDLSSSGTFQCTAGMIFSPAEKQLCSCFGGAASCLPTSVVIADAGTTPTPVDASGD